MKPVQFRNKMRHQILLLPHQSAFRLVSFRLLPDLFCLFFKCADDVPPLDLRLVIFVLSYIFLQNRLKFLHAVPFLIQLTLHSVQKPFLHQPLFIPAVSKQIRQSGFLQIHLLNDCLPLLVVDLILCQLIKILPGLGRIHHIVIEEIHGPVLFIGLKHLPARRKILQDHLLLPLLYHRKMMDILDTRFPVLADEIDHLKALSASLAHILAPSYHHSCQHIAGAAVQNPFHQDKRRFIRGKITLKRPVFRIPVSLMHKRRRHHLHQHRLTASVSEGQQGTLAVQMKTFVTDTDRIVVVVHINQSDGIDLTHLPSPPVPAAPCDNCSDSAGSSP